MTDNELLEELLKRELHIEGLLVFLVQVLNNPMVPDQWKATYTYNAVSCYISMFPAKCADDEVVLNTSDFFDECCSETSNLLFTGNVDQRDPYMLSRLVKELAEKRNYGEASDLIDRAKYHLECARNQSANEPSGVSLQIEYGDKENES